MAAASAVTEPSRAAHLSRLAGAPVDVLVIGGGITGAGVALDAAARGYTVGLVEQGDFACGTSSRSTKLIHGGIRYLAGGHFRLVREALRERAVLGRLAPWLVRRTEFLIPVYAGLRRPLGVSLPAPLRPFAPLGIRVALWGYDRLTGDPALAHRRLGLDEVARRAPALVREGLRAAYLYVDAQADDVRLTHAVLETARRHGALTVNYARTVAFLRGAGRIEGAVIEDRLGGATHTVRVRYLVNATGIWAAETAALDAAPPFRLRASKGIHLILRPGAADAGDAGTAVVLPETDDGRVLFLIPWAGRMLLGTTDDPYEGPLERPRAEAGEVAYLLDHANRYLVRPLGPADIAGVYAGVRPLIASREDAPSHVSREHAVVTSSGGLTSIIGGKLTSYRQMAEDTVNRLVRLDGAPRAYGSNLMLACGEVRGRSQYVACRTASLPLAGTVGWEAARQVLGRTALTDGQRDHLLGTYGARAAEVAGLIAEDPDLGTPLLPPEPVVAAEVLYACRHEMCVTLADFMLLRSRLSVIRDEAGAPAVDRVERLMAPALGWDVDERRRQRAAWEDAVAEERAVLGQVRGPIPGAARAISRSRPGP